uniref:Uncharacterized protein n=1 Tax=Solanum lycopersicum TaxID=4081 RepID=A0A3Q7JQS7_SOLLC
MGPVRGHKKKRKVEKKVEKDSLASGSSENGSADWWEMLSKRVAVFTQDPFAFIM